MMRFSAVDDAVDRCRRCATSMTGYVVVVKMSPAAITSERAEEHDAVAVGVRGRHVNDLHRLRR